MEPRPPEPVVFTGLDEVPAALSPLLSIPAALALGALMRLALGWVPALILGAGVIALLAGSRYRLTISVEGIELVDLWAWIVPAKRRRYPLDAAIDRYQSFEADEPEGLCIEPKVGWGQKPSDCFGPHFNQERLTRVYQLASEALVRCRAARPSTAQPPRFDVHPELNDALETLGRDYWVSSRLHRARLARDLDVGGVRLPSGTVIEANAEGYLDPRSPDRLHAAILSAPTPLPLLEKPLAQAGCRLGFDTPGRVYFAQGAFGEKRALQGVVIDGASTLSWNERGQLTDFTLGAPLPVGERTLAEGSVFRVWPTFLGKKPPSWYVHPGAPLELPQLVVPRSATIIVAADFSRILSVMPKEDLTVEGVTLRAGLLHWPLDQALRIDLRACRKMGLVKP